MTESWSINNQEENLSNYCFPWFCKKESTSYRGFYSDPFFQGLGYTTRQRDARSSLGLVPELTANAGTKVLLSSVKLALVAATYRIRPTAKK